MKCGIFPTQCIQYLSALHTGETSQLQELIAPIAVISFIIILLLVSFGILVSMLMLQKHLKTKRMQRYYESLTPVQRMLLKVSAPWSCSVASLFHSCNFGTDCDRTDCTILITEVSIFQKYVA